MLAENLRREEEWGEDEDDDAPDAPEPEDDAAAPGPTDAEAWAEARRAVEAGEWKG